MDNEAMSAQDDISNVETSDLHPGDTQNAVGGDERNENLIHDSTNRSKALDTEDDAPRPLDDLAWDELQQAHDIEMTKQTKEENDLKHRFQRLTSVRAERHCIARDQLVTCLQLYMDWASMPEAKEHERAAKRLRTRIAYVKHEEEGHAARQQHCGSRVMCLDAMRLM